MGKRIVRLADIAKELNISITAVSRALKDKNDISEELKEKVRKTADEMGYIPDTIANFMRQKRTNIIAIVVSSLSNPYYTIMVSFLSKKIQDSGYYCVTLVSDELGGSVISKISALRACAVISFSDISFSDLDYFKDNEITLISLGINSLNKEVISIFADNELGGELVGEEFLKSECKKPCYIGSSPNVLNVDRKNGFVNKLNFNSISVEEFTIRFEKRAKSKDELVNFITSNKFDFIFCFNDEIASYVIEVLGEANYQNYVIYGFDGVSEYLPICRKINSIGYDYEKVAHETVKMIIDKLENDKEIVSKKHEVKLIKYSY